MVKRCALVVVGAIGGLFLGVFASHLPGGSSDWAAWVQGLGSLLGLGVAVGIAFYQSRATADALRQSEVRACTDAHNRHLRVLETARDLILAMERMLAHVILMVRPGANLGSYNRRADIQTIVTLGDLLATVPLFEIQDPEAMLSIVAALGQVDRYRIMVEKDAFNAELGFTEQFRLHSDTLAKRIDEIRAKGPAFPVHH